MVVFPLIWILLQQLIYLKIIGTKYRPRRIVLYQVNQNEIMILDDTTPVKLERKPFKKEYDNFIFEYDGYYGFKVTKR